MFGLICGFGALVCLVTIGAGLILAKMDQDEVRAETETWIWLPEMRDWRRRR